MKNILLSILTAISIAVLIYLGLQSDRDHILPVHDNYYRDQSFYDNAFDKAKPEPARDGIVGITVNHHLIAPDLVAQSLMAAKNLHPSTIVLISPNHFSAGYGRFISSNENWATPYGTMSADQKLIKKLVKQDEYFNVDESPFANEHGIYGIVPFLKKVFPDAKIVPIIVKDQASFSEVDAFSEILDKNLPKDALIVGSFDFSHYLTGSASEFSDIKNLAVLETFDYNSMDFMDVDSKTGLRLMLKLLDKRGAKKFNLVSHTDSSKLAGNDSLVETTSYINGNFTAGDMVQNDSISVLYFGSWDEQGISHYGDWRKPAYALGRIDRLMAGTDILIGNSPDAGAQTGLDKLGYRVALNPNHTGSFEYTVRGQKARIIRVDSDSDLSLLTSGSGPVIVITNHPEFVSKIAPKAAALYVDGPTKRIDLVGTTPILYGFGQSSFTAQVKATDDILAGLVIKSGRVVQIKLFPTVFSSILQLKTGTESDIMLLQISNDSVESLRNQIKTGTINL